jgi:Htaa
MPRSLARRLRLPALAVLALGLLPSAAAASTVVGGGFDWSMANYYDSGARDTLGQRTWLGFVVNTVPVAGPASAGSVTASGGATIADRSGASVGTVDGASPAGLAEIYTLTQPATGGTYDEYTGVGSIQLGGTLTWAVHPASNPPRTMVNPTLTLDGNSGTLTATGEIEGRSYGAELGPIFTFNLQSSLVTLNADGTRVISAIARATHNPTFFSARYLPSNGTETFALRLKLRADEIRGPQGPAGPEGKPGKTVRLQTSVLRKAPRPDGGKVHAIELLTTKTKTLVAKGSVRSRTIRVRLADSQTKRLQGVYLLKIGEQPAVRVRVL